MKRFAAVLLLSFVVFALVLPAAVAHEPNNLGNEIRNNTVRLVLWGSLGVIALVGLAAFLKSKRKGKELPAALSHVLFFSIAFSVIGITAYVAGSTIYLNVVSSTNGPVHWHADFEVWHCGQWVDLVDPTGFSNRVGEPVLHEHNDNRMHIEGVVVERHDVSIGNFWRSVGGELSQGWLKVPANSGEVTMKDGDSCGDGTGTLQVFVWKSVDGKAVQQKLGTGYEDYVPSGHGNIPPGDCIIFEFGELKDRTEHMCASYKVAIERGALNGG